ncbi:hypothetical protein [Flindersiella endophytica]
MNRIAQAVAVAGMAAASIVPLGVAANASQPAPQRIGPAGICPPGTCGPYGTNGACEVNRAEVIAAGGRAPEPCYYYGVVPDQGWYFYRIR